MPDEKNPRSRPDAMKPYIGNDGISDLAAEFGLPPQGSAEETAMMGRIHQENDLVERAGLNDIVMPALDGGLGHGDEQPVDKVGSRQQAIAAVEAADIPDDISVEEAIAMTKGTPAEDIDARTGRERSDRSDLRPEARAGFVEVTPPILEADQRHQAYSETFSQNDLQTPNGA